MQAAAQIPDDTAAELATELAAERREMRGMGMHLTRLVYDHAVQQLEDPDPGPKTKTRPVDYLQAFNRLVQTMRNLHALEARFAPPSPAAKRPVHRPVYRPVNPTDPRRPILQHALHAAARNQPGQAALRRALDDALNQALDADPAAETPPMEIFEAIAEEFNLPIDVTKLHDDVLFGIGKGPRPAPGSIQIPDDAPPFPR